MTRTKAAPLCRSLYRWQPRPTQKKIKVISTNLSQTCLLHTCACMPACIAEARTWPSKIPGQLLDFRFLRQGSAAGGMSACLSISRSKQTKSSRIRLRTCWSKQNQRSCCAWRPTRFRKPLAWIYTPACIGQEELLAHYITRLHV